MTAPTWMPHPGPQTLLVAAPFDDILCGGARGGGKTQGMLGRWLRRQATYGRHARGVWFRRSIPEIEGALVEMNKLFIPVGARYEVQRKTWTFPSGAELKLRYLESDNDANRYIGHEYTDLYADDAGTWASPAPIDLLRGTLRSAAGVPCSMVLSANPANVGHEWIKRRYLDDPVTGQRRPPNVPFVADGITRIFIPSTLRDNPAIGGDHREKYIAQLRLSGPDYLVRAWIDGDWDVEPDGAMLETGWLAVAYDVPPTLDRNHRRPRVVLSVDPAEDIATSNDETGIVAAALNGYYADMLHMEATRLLLEPLEQRLIVLCEAFRPDLVIVEKKSVGGAIVQNLKRRRDWKWPVQAVDPGQMSKAERLWEQVPWFQGGRVRFPSERAQALLPHVPLPANGTMDWLDGRRELGRFTGNPKRRERDNRVDATSQLLRHMTASPMAGLLSD